MRKNVVVKRTEDFIRRKLSGDATGHDAWHSQRVRRVAEHICKTENADLFIVRLAALLHDIADWKFHNGDTQKGPRMARRFLKSLGVGEAIREQVAAIIEHLSFKGAGVADTPMPLEGRIVRDADRLDALGAIGIARAFAYGGSRGREMHNPKVRPQPHATFRAYKKGAGPTVNHFYEKLFFLKDRMHTKTGRALAVQRHRFMEKYLEQFYSEWEFNG